jgi:nicotinamidase-related amidase
MLIDIQDFYFAGGRVPLVEPDAAAANAARVLKVFREKSWLVVHVRHNSQPGGDIHDSVAPLPEEKVISKDTVNCFVGTELLDYLRTRKVTDLVICGMQTHMCLEAAARAGKDHGFRCTVITDACATRDLKFGDRTVSAADVHASTLGTLNRTYATVVDTETYIQTVSDKK